MNTSPVSYKRHRFPPRIIAHAVWLNFRFPLNLRLVEEMLRVVPQQRQIVRRQIEQRRSLSLSENMTSWHSTFEV